MATSGKQLSSLPNVSNFGGTNEMLTWVGDGLAQKVTRDEFMASLPENRQAATAYTVGTIKYHPNLPTGYYLECTTAGITSAGDITPSSTIGDTVSDGTVTWTVSKDLSVRGGTILGNISLNNGINNIISASGTQSVLSLQADQNPYNGSQIVIYGIEAADRGIIMYAANDYSTHYAVLSLKPDGDLWLQPPGTQVANLLSDAAIVAKSLGANGYIKYASGLILQWGEIIGNSGVDYIVSFPVTFSTKPSFILTPVNGTNIYTNLTSIGPDGGTFKCSSPPTLVEWIAVGY
jgi:hypothetical protein